MRPLTFAACLCVLALVGSFGCVPSTPLQPGQIDEYWSLTQDVTQDAPLSQPTFGQQKLPAYWVVKQTPSVVWSTVSIVRAVDKMKLGANEVSFSISQVHTKTLIDLIEFTRSGR